MDTKLILIDLRAERDKLNQVIFALEALNGTAPNSVFRQPLRNSTRTTVPDARPTSANRVISPESRKRMAEAQRKRWAKKKRAAKAVARKAITAATH